MRITTVNATKPQGGKAHENSHQTKPAGDFVKPSCGLTQGLFDMATYWLSYRLEDDATYHARYEALIETVQNLTTKWWLEPSSLIVFASDSTIDTIAAAIKRVIDSGKDIAVLGMPDFKSARLIGANQDRDIFDLIPFIKKV